MPAMSQDRPSDACVLVGYCHRRGIVVSSRKQLFDPMALIVILALGMLDDRPSTVDKKAAQVAVSALTDSSERFLPAT